MKSTWKAQGHYRQRIGFQNSASSKGDISNFSAHIWLVMHSVETLRKLNADQPLNLVQKDPANPVPAQVIADSRYMIDKLKAIAKRGPLTRLVNPNIRPPGGYYFIDSEGMRFESEDLPRLIANLGNYRNRTGRDLGDPWVEVTEQILQRHPELEAR